MKLASAIGGLAAAIVVLIVVSVWKPLGDVNWVAVVICLVLTLGAALRVVSAVTGWQAPFSIQGGGPQGMDYRHNPYDDGPGGGWGGDAGGPSGGDTGGGGGGGPAS